MKTFLFAWNPKRWDWTSLVQNIDEIEQTGRATQKWSVKGHKKIQPGDRAFLVRLGKKNPKGIMASGFVATPSFLSRHWGEDKLVNRVIIEFDIILNPDKDTLLTLDVLMKGKLANVNWTPQSSGIEIDKDVTDELEATWFKFLTTQDNSYKLFKDNEQKVYFEGTPNLVLNTIYERNPFAREMCIAHYGLSCSVCEFNFEKEYGELGKDFIHVHHLNQISNIGKEYEIDPIKDLRPVCPNCHAMIHKRKKPYTIDELKEKIRRNR